MCFGEYMIYKGSNLYNMSSCETIELFYNIRTDLDKLNIASEITKIINDVTNENQNSYKILRLYLNTLYIISEKEKNLKLVLATFKLKLISILGFMPEIKKCTECKSEENLRYFSLKSNGFKCETCGAVDKSCIKMQNGTKDAIRYTILSPIEKLYSFNIPEEIIRELDLISKLYFNEKIEN